MESYISSLQVAFAINFAYSVIESIRDLHQNRLWKRFRVIEDSIIAIKDDDQRRIISGEIYDKKLTFYSMADKLKGFVVFAIVISLIFSLITAFLIFLISVSSIPEFSFSGLLLFIMNFFIPIYSIFLYVFYKINFADVENFLKIKNRQLLVPSS